MYYITMYYIECNDYMESCNMSSIVQYYSIESYRGLKSVPKLGEFK